MLRAHSANFEHIGGIVMGWSHREISLTYLDPGRAYPGYTLFAPNGGEKAHLIDMEDSLAGHSPLSKLI